MSAAPRRVVLVSGLSGAGKLSVLRALEDLGYETVDNPPLRLLADMVDRAERHLAVGVDARTRGFDEAEVLAVLDRLRADARLHPALVYANATDDTLLRRYTETRRRHPLAPAGRVMEGITAERALTARLCGAADLVIDTSNLEMAGLRQLIEHHFAASDGEVALALNVSLMSFAYPAGLPREADLVFDSRFLRNPHYDAALRPRTGLNPEVGAYIAADPDCARFLQGVSGLLDMLLPRFVQEGKKYATIAVGCTGGRHRSVYVVEELAAHLRASGWPVSVVHTALAGRPLPEGPASFPVPAGDA